MVCIFFVEVEWGFCCIIMVCDFFDEVEEVDIECVIMFVNVFVFVVCGKEELFEVIVVDGNKFDFFEEFLWCKVE